MSVQRPVLINDSRKYLGEEKGSGEGGERDCAYHGDYQLGVYVL